LGKITEILARKRIKKESLPFLLKAREPERRLTRWKGQTSIV
jgi:hypothetical protein